MKTYRERISSILEAGWNRLYTTANKVFRLAIRD